MPERLSEQRLGRALDAALNDEGVIGVEEVGAQPRFPLLRVAVNGYVPLGPQVVAEQLVEAAAVHIRRRIDMGRDAEDLVEQRGHAARLLAAGRAAWSRVP